MTPRQRALCVLIAASLKFNYPMNNSKYVGVKADGATKGFAFIGTLNDKEINLRDDAQNRILVPTLEGERKKKITIQYITNSTTEIKMELALDSTKFEASAEYRIEGQIFNYDNVKVWDDEHKTEKLYRIKW